MVAIKLDTDERIVLAIMNLQVAIENLLITGDPNAAAPALEESKMVIDPMATQILNKMTKPMPAAIIEDGEQVIIDFKKKISKKEIETETETEGNSDTP